MRAGAWEGFERTLSAGELELMQTLSRPSRIQSFLDGIKYSTDPFYRCPLRVLRERQANCFDGAVFAAAALRRLGRPPLIVDLFPNERDDEHMLAPFREDGHWGAVAMSNFVGLRFREPIHRSLRDLVLSYFEQYYNLEREKTLRAYTRPLNLSAYDRFDWIIRDDPLEEIARHTERQRRVPLLTEAMIERLSLLDERSYRAGLHGSDPQGLFVPEPPDMIE